MSSKCTAARYRQMTFSFFSALVGERLESAPAKEYVPLMREQQCLGDNRKIRSNEDSFFPALNDGCSPNTTLLHNMQQA